MKQRFEMTKEQHERLLDACKPVPYLVFGGHVPRSPQENANAAWQRLGDELGFDWMTVEPVPGEPSSVFRATPVAKETA